MRQYLYKVIDFSNYDGDSMDLSLDLGFNLTIHRKCRMFGIDTPELRGGTAISKAAGYLAKEIFADWCIKAMEDGLYFASENYSGKFGRPLGDMLNASGESLREYLIKNNYGVPYHGQAKAEIQALHDANYAILKERGEIPDE